MSSTFFIVETVKTSIKIKMIQTVKSDSSKMIRRSKMMRTSKMIKTSWR
jgi:hypothetical protein